MNDHRCRRGERCCEAVRTERRAPICTACECHTGPYRPCTIPGGCGHLHKQETVKQGGPIMAADGLCPTCTRVVTDAITQLPRDYVELHVALQHGTTGMAELVSSTPDPPAPLRVAVAALAAELVRVTTTWAEPTSDRLSIAWDSQLMDRHTRPGVVLQRACHLLALNLSVLLALRDVEIQTWSDDGRYHSTEPSDGITAALTMLELHHTAKAVLGQTTLVHELPAPCPTCGHMSLIRDNGADNVHCRHCKLVWSENDYRRLTVILAATVV